MARRTSYLFHLLLALIVSSAVLTCGASLDDRQSRQHRSYSEIEAEQQGSCARTCAEVKCDTLGLRYGKYCGVGWGGCPGEAPCDDLDACCRKHDKCAGEFGVQAVQCHKKFKKCMQKVQASGKTGFSSLCPYEKVIPMLVQGMDLAITLSQFASGQGIIS
ncbi:unnamed protein product [Closterium sp. Naga37s-1]|nr:unnamed protein product [Closterium sp. Naga37s-1]